MRVSSVLLSVSLAQSALGFTAPIAPARTAKPEREENGVVQMLSDGSNLSPTDVVAPLILLAGAIGATIKFAPEKGTEISFAVPEPVATTPVPAPAPAPAPVVSIPVPEPEPVPVPEPEPVPEPVLEITNEEDPKTNFYEITHPEEEEAVEVDPLPVPVPASAATRDISEIRREIAYSKDDEAAKQILTRSKSTESDEKEAKKEASPAAAAAASQEDFKKVFKSPQTGKKRRFVKRVLKKVIAPWRKWENIG